MRLVRGVSEARVRGKKRALDEAEQVKRAKVRAKARVKVKSKAKAKAVASSAAVPTVAEVDVPVPGAAASSGNGSSSSSSGGVAVALRPEPVPPVIGAAASSGGVAVPEAGPEDVPERPAGHVRVPPRALRGSRAELFGSSFVLAEVHPQGVFSAWSCRCYLHTAEGQQCNKTFTFRGGVCDAAEAKWRIMQWCVNGISIPDGVGARACHMSENPAAIPRTALLPVHVLQDRAQCA